MQVAIILMNLLAGPPLFRAAVIASGEARFGVGRAESVGELGSKDHERPPFEFDHRPPCAPLQSVHDTKFPGSRAGSSAEPGARQISCCHHFGLHCPLQALRSCELQWLHQIGANPTPALLSQSLATPCRD